MHWIDEVSESMLAEFASVVPKIAAMVLITYRPEFRGALSRTSGAPTIALAPLDDSETAALTSELLGPHPSVERLGQRIAERSAGNPFFAEEMVRDLAERGVLDGRRGDYVCVTDAADVGVPATLQATIAARIDRLSGPAKRTLNAAAVIGSRFTADLLNSLVGDGALSELVDADLIDPVTSSPRGQYAFRHPLIQTVAYESQLRSGRSQLHQRLATAIEELHPGAVEENAALIATHLEAAGDLRAAFGWHMRAAAWSTNRDIGSARVSWQRARHVADLLPPDDPEGMSMRVAPRTLLCATAWRVGGSVADTGFEQLRALTTAAGDKRSLAIGMSGLLLTLAFHGEFRAAARLASEYANLLESIGDSAMTVGLLFGAVVAKWEAGETAEALRLAQRVIDLADGDPSMGNLIIGSPLALALAMRGSAKSCLGHPGWKNDLEDAIAMAREFDPFSRVLTIMFKSLTIGYGALLPDTTALRETAEALASLGQSGDDFTLANTWLTRGATLTLRDEQERQHGFEMLAMVRQAALQQRFTISAVWFENIQIAREMARSGDLDHAIETVRTVIDALFEAGNMIWRGLATTTLVELLLGRVAPGDLSEAQAAIDKLAAVPTDPGFALHDLPLLRLRALLARAHGDEATYQTFVERYRARAEECGFEGHLAAALDMT